MSRVVVIAGVAALFVALAGPTGVVAEASGDEPTCADRCNYGRVQCMTKCHEPKPGDKDAKGDAKEPTLECTKKCEIDPKHTVTTMTPKEKACVKACLTKARPCNQVCGKQHHACMSHCG